MKFGGTSVADPDAINRLIAIVRPSWQIEEKTPASGCRPWSWSRRCPKVSPTSWYAARRPVRIEDGEGARRQRPKAEEIAVGAAHCRRDGGHQRELAAPAVHRPRAPARSSTKLNGLRHGHALSVLREVSPRSRDAVHAVGEVVSSRIVAAAFADHGMPSAWVDARDGGASPTTEHNAARRRT